MACGPVRAAALYLPLLYTYTYPLLVLVPTRSLYRGGRRYRVTHGGSCALLTPILPPCRFCPHAQRTHATTPHPTTRSPPPRLLTPPPALQPYLPTRLHFPCRADYLPHPTTSAGRAGRYLRCWAHTHTPAAGDPTYPACGWVFTIPVIPRLFSAVVHLPLTPHVGARATTPHTVQTELADTVPPRFLRCCADDRTCHEQAVAISLRAARLPLPPAPRACLRTLARPPLPT